MKPKYICIFILFFLPSTLVAQLEIEYLYPNVAFVDEEIEMVVVGKGFIEDRTRVYIFPERENKYSIIGMLDTPGQAKRIVVNENVAYIADGTAGLQIIDVQNPFYPQLLSNIPTSDTTEDIVLHDGIAYIADSSSGLKIFDITNPSNPQLLSIVCQNGDVRGVDVNRKDEILYAVDYDNGLQIISIKEESASRYKILGSKNDIFVSDFHDIIYARDKVYLYEPGIFNYLYLFESTSMIIINVSYPSFPSYIFDDLYNFDTLCSDRILGLFSLNDSLLFYTSDSNPDKLSLVNITADNYIQLGSLELFDINTPTGIYAVGEICCITEGKYLRFIDFYDYANLKNINIVDLPSAANAVEISNNLAYIVNNETGLVIVPLPTIIQDITYNDNSIVFDVPPQIVCGEYALKVIQNELHSQFQHPILYNKKETDISIYPTNHYDFKDVHTGTTVLSKKFIIHNTKNYPVPIEIHFIGENASEFSLSNMNSFNMILSPSEHHAITIHFSPITAGIKTSSCEIRIKDLYQETFKISLKGMAYKEERYKFYRMWPTLKQAWYFNNIQDIAVDQDNYIYIAKPDVGILKYSYDGKLCTHFDPTLNSQLDSNINFSVFLDIDQDGYIYAITGDYDKEGQNFLISILGADIKRYDISSGLIQKFDLNGKLLSEWGKNGIGDNILHSLPFDIAVKNNIVFLISSSENENKYLITQYTTEGEYISSWEIDSYSDYVIGGSFNDHIYGLEVNEDNQIFVYRKGLGLQDSVEIKKYSTEGLFLDVWDISASNDIPSYNYDIDINNEDIYVSINDGKILKCTSEGKCITEYEGGWPIAINKQKNVIISGGYGLNKYQIDNKSISTWSCCGSDDGRFNNPSKVVIDKNSNIYIVDQTQIQKFTKDGDLIKNWNYPTNTVLDYNYYTNGNSIFLEKKYINIGDGYQWSMSVNLEPDEILSTGDLVVDNEGMIYIFYKINDVISSGPSYILKLKHTNGFEVISKICSQDIDLGEYWTGGLGVNNNHLYIANSIIKYQVFTKDLRFIENINFAGQFFFKDITMDAQGFIYGIDELDQTIYKVTSRGTIISTFGDFGIKPGLLSKPVSIDVSVDGELVCIVDSENCRLQTYRKKALNEGISKAIIVAGGGYPDSLWHSTLICTNFAYRTLQIHGFSKNEIRFLSSNAKNTNQEIDHTIYSSKENLQDSIENWAIDANRLIIYLTDHGLDNKFKINNNKESDISERFVDVSELNTWVNKLQSNNENCEVIIIYDACKSGSFISDLSPSSSNMKRIIITSTLDDEDAHFVTYASVSFSNYFWTNIFNGNSLGDSFNSASNSMQYPRSFQTPQYKIYGYPSIDDMQIINNIYLGSGDVRYSETTAEITTEISTPLTNTCHLKVNIESENQISRVWAFIIPPNFNLPVSDYPLLEYPSIDFTPKSDNRFEAYYNNLFKNGEYQFIINAIDDKGNELPTQLVKIESDSSKKIKAVIITGNSNSTTKEETFLSLSKQAFDSFSFQGYKDNEIYFIAPKTISEGIDAAVTKDNITKGLREWIQTEDTQDLVIYIIGDVISEGGEKKYNVGNSETISVNEMKIWLNNLQNLISGMIVLICDTDYSGYFIRQLSDSNYKRILISSASSNQISNIPSCENTTISFSNYFWSHVFNGYSVYKSYYYAKESTEKIWSNLQTPNIDDNGNGILNDDSDYELAANYNIGFGVIKAAEMPVIEKVNPPQTLTVQYKSTIWAEIVNNYIDIEQVLAIIQPPQQSTDAIIKKYPMIKLIKNNNRYEATYPFINKGIYKISIIAKDIRNQLSVPETTQITQTESRLIKGDINGDGDTDLKDIIIALKIIVGINQDQMIRYDYNQSNIDIMNDDQISLMDVICLLQTIK